MICEWCVLDQGKRHYCLWREVKYGNERREDWPDMGDEPCGCTERHFH